MNEQQNTQQNAAGSVGSNRCACNEVLDHLKNAFGVSPEVRKHLNNSRIELLKAVRGLIDQRIERLSNAGQHGTKITVE
jgi:hypothetical protein